MTTSQNGWPLNPTLTTIFPGKAHIQVRAGDVSVVFQYFAQRFNDEVETLVPAQCGGFNPRKIPGSNVWSDHASATAIDLNWTKHPQGVTAEHSFTPHQIETIHHLLNVCDGVLHWGATYTNPDPMHFSIHGTATDVARLARKIQTPAPPTNVGDMTEAEFKDWTEGLMGEIANAALPDGDPKKIPTTQAGRNGLVYLRRIFTALSGGTTGV